LLGSASLHILANYFQPLKWALGVMMEYVQLSSSCELPDISHFGKFKSVVIVEEKVSEIRQYEISKWLVNSGCLYMMAWGIEASSWDTSVDLANIEQFENAEIPDESLVLTTWHDDELLSEVFEFAKFSALHSYHELKSIIVHISSINKESELRSVYNAT
jgi:hypothetical protein